MAPRRSRLFVLVAAGVLITGLALSPAAVGAANDSDIASGHISIFSTQIDFRATSTNTNTDARGRIRMTFQNSDPNQVFTAEVTCMDVIAATATTPATAVISGRITDQPAGSFALSILVNVTDSGKFANAPDGIQAFLSSAVSPQDSACPAPFTFFSPVVDGDVVIQNTLP